MDFALSNFLKPKLYRSIEDAEYYIYIKGFLMFITFLLLTVVGIVSLLILASLLNTTVRYFKDWKKPPPTIEVWKDKKFAKINFVFILLWNNYFYPFISLNIEYLAL